MYKCKLCQFETDIVTELANHYQYNHKKIHSIMCEKCGKKFKNEKGLKQHTKKSCEKNIKNKQVNHICPKCGLYISNSIEKHIKSCNGYGPRRSRHQPKKEKKTFKNISFDERYGVEKSKIIKKKISEKLKGRNGQASTYEKEIERRKKISEHAKKNNYGGYIRGSGRGKKGWYKGYWCDSSWELAWVIYQLDNNNKIKRNLKKFEYNYKNEKHHYIPDFIMYGKYYEIKGYMTEKSKEKIKQFNEKIIVVDKEKIKPILEYVEKKYGKNYISLYENYKPKICKNCGKEIYRKNKSGLCIICFNQSRKNIKIKKVKKEINYCECGKIKNKRSKLCKECSNIKRRKIYRPDYYTLIKEINDFGYTETGRKYGVSDNTIRKWKRFYENKKT